MFANGHNEHSSSSVYFWVMLASKLWEWIECAIQAYLFSELVSTKYYPRGNCCFLLISLSSYFYFSGTGVFSFSPYTALLILEQELLIFLLCSVCASLPLVFYLVNSPSFLSNLAHSVLHLRNTPPGACVAADSVLHVLSSGKSKLFWDAAWLKNALRLSGQNPAGEQVMPLAGPCPGAGGGAQSWILHMICWRSGNSQV